MWLLTLLACADLPYLYDRSYYEAALLRWVDNDGDGFREVDGDCDDTTVAINPSTEELCNDADDDCDGEIDEEALDAAAWFQDLDQDGVGNEQVAYVACETPTGFSSISGDCDDADSAIYPGAPEACGTAEDLNCDGVTGDYDGDGDGYAWCAECDDTSVLVNPDAIEICNGGIDDDCSGDADGADALGAVEWYLDDDNDNFGAGEPLIQCLAPANYATVDGDCDDTNDEVSPDETEICNNGLDDNCDGDANGCRTEGSMPADAQLTADGGTFIGIGLGSAGDVGGDDVGDLLITGGTQAAYPNGSVFLVEGPLDRDGPLTSAATGVITTSADSGIRVILPLADAVDFEGDGVEDWWIWAVSDEAGVEYAVHYLLQPQTGEVLVDEAAYAAFWSTRGDTYFGYAITPAGDQDGNGWRDVAIGALYDSEGGTQAGAVYLFTEAGPDLTEADAAWFGVGESAGSYLGASLVAEDFDGDGVTDVLAGAPGRDGDTGAVAFFSGPLGGASTWEDAAAVVTGETNSSFGLTSCAAGDANDDGRSDAWIAAPFADGEGSEAGVVYLLTDITTDGTVDTRQSGAVSGEVDGRWLAYGGSTFRSTDMDNDGVFDLVLSSPNYSDGSTLITGKIYLLYAPISTGTTSVADADAWHVGTSEYASAGYSLLAPGDVSGDSNPDIIATEFGEVGGSSDRVNVLFGFSY